MFPPPTRQAASEGAARKAMLDLERDKLREDTRLRDEELRLKGEDTRLREQEIGLREKEFQRSRWSSPLVVAIFTGAAALVGNIAVSYHNSSEQRAIETSRAEATRTLEQEKAEAARILEMIKTNDPEKAASNLKFLIDAGLVRDSSERLQNFLASRKPGEGPVLPALPETSAAPEFKGLQPRPYLDADGVWAIGFGSTLGVGPDTPELSDEEARQLYRQEIVHEHSDIPTQIANHSLNCLECS